MDIRKAVPTVLAGLAFAGLGYAWLNPSSQSGSGQSAGDGPAVIATPRRAEVLATQNPPPRESAAPSPRLAVMFEGGLLSVRTHRTPLKDVLAAITRATGLTFVLDGDADEQLSIDLSPRPVREVVSGLLDQASYGYAFVEPARGTGGAGPLRVFLIKQRSSGDASGSKAASQQVPGLTAPGPTAVPSSPPDEAALQQQRAVDALFDACKEKGCDTS